jgi:hypothetical protein
MRSTKLVPALAASTALLALAAAGASARPVGPRHASHGAANPAGGCRVTLETPKYVVTFGEPVTLSGALTCANPGGQTVTIYQGAIDSHSFTVAGTAMTEPSGAYQFSPPPLTASTSFYTAAAGQRSGLENIRLAPQVTLTSPADGTQVATGASNRRARALNSVTFNGKVNPIEVDARVSLQRENATANEEWHPIDAGVVNGAGEYSIHHVFSAPGAANIRVVVHSVGTHRAPGASSPISLEISQRQHPQLTINSSADPISYGQSVTISGVAAGAAGQPLSLLARNPGGKFASVATTTTSAGGTYTFNQSPLRNTAYQVAGAKTKSAILFEGVKYVLTAAPAALTTQAGQVLTITGTVKPPVPAGHAIYIERGYRSGIGFHLLVVGTVSAAGTYSISHTFFAGDVLRLRIYIPGDPVNQGVASSVFDVSVTPAPAGTLLKPQTAGKQPDLGKL